MKKKILSTLLAGAAIATMGVTSASANTLDAISGDLKFQFDGWSASQTQYSANCNSALDCDSKSIGGPAAAGANGDDDAWGFANVNVITDSSPIPAWTAGTDGDILLTYFHGFRDVSVVTTGTDTVFASTGGVVDIYRIDVALYTDVIDAMNVVGADQQDLEDILALAGYELYLHLEFFGDCGAVAGASFCSNFDTDIGEFGKGSSNGTAKVEFPGGSAESKYPDDFLFTQDTESCVSLFDGVTRNGDCSEVEDNDTFILNVRGGEATTTVLPEPGALGLLGLGLVGMGLLGRRRKA